MGIICENIKLWALFNTKISIPEIILKLQIAG